MPSARIPSPLGDLLLVAEGGALTGLYVADHPRCVARDDEAADDSEAFSDARRQLEEYFAGERTGFDLRLEPRGTPFQRRVWYAVLAIPYGCTTTYGEIARRIDSPNSARAVGAANGRNPISLIIPCHRVIGAGGGLTGYGWGTDVKAWLLRHDQAAPSPNDHGEETG